MSIASTRALSDVLHPNKVRTSPRFTAMLGYILDEDWTEPRIIELVATSDGMLLAATTDDPLLDDFIGDVESLWENLRGIAAAAGMTEAETARLLLAAKSKVRRA